jgi:hypothetical protein
MITRSFFLLLLSLALADCATAPKPPPPPTLEEIVQMSQQGVPASEIIAKLTQSRAAYRVTGSQLARLKEQGVADEVLDYIHESALALAREEEARRQAQMRFMYGWPYYGPYPYWWYYPPPPVRPH